MGLVSIPARLAVAPFGALPRRSRKQPAPKAPVLTVADLAPEAPTVLPPAPVAAQPGLLDRFNTGLDHVGQFLHTNTQHITSLLDSVGHLRKSAKVSQVEVQAAWDRDIKAPPTASWFELETIFPGVSNGVVAGGAAVAALLGLVLLMRPASQRA